MSVASLKEFAERKLRKYETKIAFEVLSGETAKIAKLRNRILRKVCIANHLQDGVVLRFHRNLLPPTRDPWALELSGALPPRRRPEWSKVPIYRVLPGAVWLQLPKTAHCAIETSDFILAVLAETITEPLLRTATLEADPTDH